jgi:carbonic anhydrase
MRRKLYKPSDTPLGLRPSVLLRIIVNYNYILMACKCFKELVEGNQEFVDNPKYIKQRKETATGQEPCTVVVTCSDSRVTPPIIFSNTNLGTFFEIQTAGESLESNDIESIKYAIVHLHSKLVVVVGHTNCGAVKATVDSLLDPEIRNEFPSIVSSILPSVLIEMKRQKITIDDIKSDPKLKHKLVEDSIIRNAIDKARLVAFLLDLECDEQVVPGVYNTLSGKVTWYKINDCLSAN